MEIEHVLSWRIFFAVKKGQSHSINIISRDVEKCVVQQKDYEGGENDCEVNMSANP